MANTVVAKRRKISWRRWSLLAGVVVLWFGSVTFAGVTNSERARRKVSSVQLSDDEDGSSLSQLKFRIRATRRQLQANLAIMLQEPRGSGLQDAILHRALTSCALLLEPHVVERRVSESMLAHRPTAPPETTHQDMAALRRLEQETR
jgi:hypothetical protein